jgi:hypothetical protein
MAIQTKVRDFKRIEKIYTKESNDYMKHEFEKSTSVKKWRLLPIIYWKGCTPVVFWFIPSDIIPDEGCWMLVMW